MRRALSKRLRFEVFKRDGFRCVYCGATPSSTVLRVDHVLPVKRGGTDDASNLVTACHDCNGGKSDVPLDEHRLVTLDAAAVREHAEQILAYLAAQRELDAANETVLDAVREIWEETYPSGNTKQELGILRAALREFTVADVMEWVRQATVRTWSRTRAIKYFCGIVRNERARRAAA